MGSGLSEKSLENIALHYLQRFSTSVENLRRVLTRRTDRRLKEQSAVTREQVQGWIDALLKKLQRAGLLADARYARMTAESLTRRGQSLRKVQLKLRSKGLHSEALEEGARAVRTLNDEGGGVSDGVAAFAYAKRRRLGPFRKSPADAAKRQKELASLARAGFPYALARRIVEAETPDALERALDWEPDPS